MVSMVSTGRSTNDLQLRSEVTIKVLVIFRPRASDYQWASSRNENVRRCSSNESIVFWHVSRNIVVFVE